jgi:hypothetical protein
MQKKIRRVVTGHSAEGKSIIVMDGPSPHVFSRGTGSVVVTELWETHGTPADNRGNEDSIRRPFRLPPPKNGSVREVVLKAGDVLIQRGTNHAWSNRTDEPAYVAFVLIDAETVGKSG